MTWTKDKPTVDGWSWLCSGGGPEIVHALVYEDGRVEMEYAGHEVSQTAWDGDFFMGPLSIPKSP